MNYLRFLLLIFLLSTASEAQSASYTPYDSIFYTKINADSAKVKKPKNRSEAVVLGIAGAAVCLTGILYGGFLMAAIGGILIIMAIYKKKNKSKNQRQKLPESKISDSSKQGIVSTGRAILLVLVGIGIAALIMTGMTYLMLSQGF